MGYHAAVFDFVIVGAGSAGCVLANRLSADPKRKVALIEAGPARHRSFKVRAPGMYAGLWRSPLDWAFSTEPQRHVDNRKLYWPRGKVVGGTSCLNAMVYMRGHRDNYDEWRDLGNAGWGWSDVLPIFKRSEGNARGESEYHGASGELAVTDLTTPSRLASAFVEATAKHCGIPITDDFNGAEQLGAGIYQHTVKAGQRASTAVAFLDPIAKRDNLTVIANASVAKLVIEGDRVRGVRLRDDKVIEGREVILAGGAIGSPQLLLLSGIGPADELRVVGIDPVHELPGVGKHLEDHLLVGVSYDVVAAAARKLTRTGMAMWAAKYLFGGGPLSTSPVEAGAFVRSAAGIPRPDHQFHVTPFGVTPPNTDERRPLPFGRFATICPGLIYPRSKGEIRLRSANPDDLPAIDPNYFSDPADLEHLVDGVELTRAIAATAPLAEVLGAERFPGPGVKTRDELRAAVRGSVNTIFHPVGTCRMGNDPLAVVDAELRVRGLDGLRVADASIMPRIIGGNTNAPVIMIAEKAAEMILRS